ncbi:MAG TPA: hypothetical protein VGK14_11815 [Novimethylophilus sp.]|jgi:uncharacterized protein (DUF3820 family)
MNPEDLQLQVPRVMPSGKYQGRLLALAQELDHNGLSPPLDPQ